ncbi:MAG TPA: hypothetical protein VFI22_07655 [Thermomicrobiales bacterium]|nr:hypothetical protein [Thermomicrobiales bacterium]
MATLTYALPIPTERIPEVRAFVAELLGPRRAEFEASWRDKGIAAERAWLQTTPAGALVLVSLEAADLRRAFDALAASQTAFDRWYRQRVQELYGVDLADARTRPQIEPLATWSAS